ncbi:McrB family protein [Rhodoferax aquaticus]|uniref:AAA+ ATPase domain-containing protein n=1 Tax=Rhodoferax aquaticus TaxID=2527691 RepID=A0A515EMM8_9BURK|nr:hypothetical protein [Rhodoferax aquaticus]QDL53920.1 hypothetical protein EXZ61_06925 [Rhodoferax aquaticus]
MIAKHEGEDVYEPSAPVYTELEKVLPGMGWMKHEGAAPRPLFRDYAKPWTATGVLDVSDQKFRLTPLGKSLVTGQTSPQAFFQEFVKRWVEDGQRPFSEMASAFLQADQSLDFRDLYFGVMLGYRRGDDLSASLNAARSHTNPMDDTPKRRLQVLLSVFEAAGAIAKEDPRPSDNDAKWIPWNTELLEEVAGIAFNGTSQPQSADLLSFVADFTACAQSSGLTYGNALVGRFLAATLTKRFCILTGLAGSGKTKLAEAFAMWLCESDQQYRVVAVGADWTGNENLLGYADALQSGKYCAPVNGALELMLRAAADPAKPYFLILDEMNLSHVERYFADFLSAMESANSQLALHGEVSGIALDGVKGGLGLVVPSKLSLPANLFIVGTVNVDETTYMFSPKVLDRANVIEFRASEADMGAFLDAPADINLAALRAQGVAFASAFVQRAKDGADIASLVDTAGQAFGPLLKADLLEVFGALSKIGAEFGFRTAKEIARFMVIHHELTGPSWLYKEALDAQVLQKLMPKLHGSARKLSGVLKELEAFATNKGLTLTLEKVKRMQQRLERDGFTSFAEA